MRKTILFSGIAILSQYSNAQVSIGPVAGAGVNRYTFSFNNNRSRNDQGNDKQYFVGGVVDMHLAHKLHLQTGVSYSLNRYLDRTFFTPTAAKGEKFRMNTVNIPICIVYKTNIKNGGHFITGIGLDGQITTGEKAFFVLPKPDTIDFFKRKNICMVLNAGYESKNGFFIRAYYQQILLNMLAFSKIPGMPGSPTISMGNHNFGISAGCLFRLRQKKNRAVKDEK